MVEVKKKPLFDLADKKHTMGVKHKKRPREADQQQQQVGQKTGAYRETNKGGARIGPGVNVEKNIPLS